VAVRCRRCWFYRPDLFDATRSRIADATGEGLAPHVDLWLAETQSSIAEARAIRAGLPQDGKPFWLSFTLKDEDTDEVPRLRSGEPVARQRPWRRSWASRRCCSTAASRK
jgi:S-methylmethionine-dependent homocysteine/selenocysteine methylase